VAASSRVGAKSRRLQEIDLGRTTLPTLAIWPGTKSLVVLSQRYDVLVTRHLSVRKVVLTLTSKKR
jgi:hypothetical protein